MLQDPSVYGLPVATTFHRSEGSLKFGYDAYIRHPHQPLEELLPHLRDKYQTDVPSYERLDWPSVEILIRQIWLRLRGGAT